MKPKPDNDLDTMRDEYDFDYDKAVTGKIYKQLRKEGAVLVLLDPDVSMVFKTASTVNAALRSLIEVAKLTEKPVVTARKLRSTRRPSASKSVVTEA